MGSLSEKTAPDYYYYMDPECSPYKPQQPNPLDDLISVYGLQDISKQVARTNPDGSKAVKLRKSYKNQIQGLSAKFCVIPTRENGKGGEISSIIFQENPTMIQPNGENESMTKEECKTDAMFKDQALFDQCTIDWDMCFNVFSQFERSYPGEFKSQGFEVEDLAFDLDGTGNSSNNSSGGGTLGVKSRKRKIKSNGSSVATPNSDIQEDFKRKRL